MTHHKSYDSELIDVNEVNKRIAYIVVNIMIFLHLFFYGILCVMLSFRIHERFCILENVHILVFYRYF